MKELFKKLYKKDSEVSFFSPGRVNLIGEHIDYNGGLVLPCIIDIGTFAEVSYSDDNKIHIYSTNFEKDLIRTIDVNDLEYRKEDGWLNYVKAVIKYMMEKGLKIDKGLDILIKGTIPSGGLSSSASLEILICNILRKMYNFNISDFDCVMLSVRVENEYIGVNSGIMDQYAIMMGKKDKATLIDCTKKEHKYIDFILEGKKLVILNTNKKRTLADSKYNERYAECMKSLEILKKYVDIEYLCDLTPEQFEKYKDKLEDETLIRRVRHVVYENARVHEAIKALSEHNLEKFYQLMKESHDSLRDDYEVTGLHLDSMVEACNEVGIVGARMTGAGFGGNAICIMNDEDLDKIPQILDIYYKKTGIKGEAIIASIGI